MSVILFRFSSNLNFLDRFLKIPQTNLMNIRPVGDELLHAEDRNDKADSRLATLRMRLKVEEIVMQTESFVLIWRSASKVMIYFRIILTQNCCGMDGRG